jgi:glycosyltransferase involved in cell wall biosynthesis
MNSSTVKRPSRMGCRSMSEVVVGPPEPAIRAPAQDLVAKQRIRPTVICVTPVRNEAWTLERFLHCAETWADVIVIADQGSTDGTREIAEASEKTIVVTNTVDGYDEGQRHRVVLEAARSVPGPRAILAIDADEALSANVLGSPEWERALRSEPGTVFTAEWINYLPGASHAWVPKTALPFGFIDDGREHNSGRFHVERIVVGPEDPRLSLAPVKLLHFQYIDWQRMKSKQRRYQCAETLYQQSKRPTQFYRQYHRMDAVPRSQVREADPAWLAEYAVRGIETTSVTSEPWYWTDEAVLAMLVEHGAQRFRRLNVWDVDWARLGAESGLDVDPVRLRDPRTSVDRLTLRWLAATQRRGPDRWATRLIQRALRPLGW